jgi:hypothetical protein
MGRKIGYLFSIKKDLAFLGFVIARNAIKQTGLPSPIRTNDSKQFPRVHFEINFVKGRDAPKSQSEFLHLQLGSPRKAFIRLFILLL